MDDISIKISFTYNDPQFGQFSDTIYADYETYRALSSNDIPNDPTILKMKQDRIDAWIISNQTPPISPTLNDIEANVSNMIDSMIAYITEFLDDLVVINAELKTMKNVPASFLTEVSNFQQYLNDALNNFNSLKN